ncbi:hypothetical protein SEA_NEFERTHENA_10 [Microbacterium phage Neferthena]|uniref:Uncharacterized protein n=1 Tax=Microbacterium phage Neferthena TaxID=2301539 RepID=A0A385D4F2_9CAUD|nr:hypothetical protein HOT92_gp10 [Microbacterium phage Neferthena]AXQ52874.1 hypothetical protein SEA_NEFERTHENA_10 [Microbacterium phage Neferthena]
MDDLNALLAPLPSYAVLTDQMKQHALDISLVPDAAGVWPGQPGYVTTYDVYWAALSLTGYMMAQPFVKQAASEGTSTTVDAPNWSAITAYFRSQSPIACATTGAILTEVPIPGLPHVVPTDMSGLGGDGYGDVDTDLT